MSLFEGISFVLLPSKDEKGDLMKFLKAVEGSCSWFNVKKNSFTIDISLYLAKVACLLFFRDFQLSMSEISQSAQHEDSRAQLAYFRPKVPIIPVETLDQCIVDGGFGVQCTECSS